MRVVNLLRLLWAAVTVWFEHIVFLHSVNRCEWPTPQSSSATDAAHVLLIADPQILDSHSYPDRSPVLTFLSQWIVDLNLRKSWRAACRTRPHAIMFLGDMMDNGRYTMPEAEYEQYYQRFRSIFNECAEAPRYFIPGNHDEGLRASPLFDEHAHSRYITHFGPLNSEVTLGNYTFILIDAPGLVEEDSERIAHGKSLHEWDSPVGRPIGFVKNVRQEIQPTILLTHIPLARDQGAGCGPLRERGTIRPGTGLGYQNTLGFEITRFLLETIQPGVVYSGDDHDYCEYVHSEVYPGQRADICEVTVKSPSIAMGIRYPGFQMLSLAPIQRNSPLSAKDYADALCLLPDQLGIYLTTYIPLLVISIVILVLSNTAFVRRHGSHGSKPIPRTPSGNRHRSSGSYKFLAGNVDIDDSNVESSAALPLPVVGSRTSAPKHHPRSRFSTILCGSLRRYVNSRWTLRRNTKRFRGYWGEVWWDIIDVAVVPIAIFILSCLWAYL